MMTTNNPVLGQMLSSLTVLSFTALSATIQPFTDPFLNSFAIVLEVATVLLLSTVQVLSTVSREEFPGMYAFVELLNSTCALFVIGVALVAITLRLYFLIQEHLLTEVLYVSYLEDGQCLVSTQAPLVVGGAAIERNLPETTVTLCGFSFRARWASTVSRKADQRSKLTAVCGTEFSLSTKRPDAWVKFLRLTEVQGESLGGICVLRRWKESDDVSQDRYYAPMELEGSQALSRGRWEWTMVRERDEVQCSALEEEGWMRFSILYSSEVTDLQM